MFGGQNKLKNKVCLYTSFLRRITNQELTLILSEEFLRCFLGFFLLATHPINPLNTKISSLLLLSSTLFSRWQF